MEGGRMFKRLLKPRGILTNMNYDNTTKMLLSQVIIDVPPWNILCMMGNRTSQ